MQVSQAPSKPIPLRCMSHVATAGAGVEAASGEGVLGIASADDGDASTVAPVFDAGAEEHATARETRTVAIAYLDTISV